MRISQSESELKASIWANLVKDSSDSNHFVFEIIVGKRRIRHTTTLKLNFEIVSKSIEDDVIQIQSRSMSNPTLSDTDFKKWNRLDLDHP